MTGITEGPFAAYWVIPVILIATLVAMYFLPFVMRLPKKTRMLIFISGFTFVVGSVDPSREGLNIITCGGVFDESIDTYRDRVLVYAVGEGWVV